MKHKALRIVERSILATLPPPDREAVVGDLREELGGIRGLVGIAFHYHLEPYRHLHDRLVLAGALLVGVLVLWIVPRVTPPSEAVIMQYPDPVSRAVLKMWAASGFTAAAAAGLLIGRWPTMRGHLSPATWHLTAILVPLTNGVAEAMLLVGSVWLGSRAADAVASRSSVFPDRPTPS